MQKLPNNIEKFETIEGHIRGNYYVIEAYFNIKTNWVIEKRSDREIWIVWSIVGDRPIFLDGIEFENLESAISYTEMVDT